MGKSVGGPASIYRNCRLLCNHWILSSVTMSDGDALVVTVLHCESVLVLTSHSGRYILWKAPLDINPSIMHSFIFHPPLSRFQLLSLKQGVPYEEASTLSQRQPQALLHYKELYPGTRHLWGKSRVPLHKVQPKFSALLLLYYNIFRKNNTQKLILQPQESL